jgi:hypothetical protein
MVKVICYLFRGITAAASLKLEMENVSVGIARDHSSAASPRPH